MKMTTPGSQHRLWYRSGIEAKHQSPAKSHWRIHLRIEWSPPVEEKEKNRSRGANANWQSLSVFSSSCSLGSGLDSPTSRTPATVTSALNPAQNLLVHGGKGRNDDAKVRWRHIIVRRASFCIGG
jgi:hypothetical protein